MAGTPLLGRAFDHETDAKFLANHVNPRLKHAAGHAVFPPRHCSRHCNTAPLFFRAGPFGFVLCLLYCFNHGHPAPVRSVGFAINEAPEHAPNRHLGVPPPLDVGRPAEPPSGHGPLGPHGHRTLCHPPLPLGGLAAVFPRNEGRAKDAVAHAREAANDFDAVAFNLVNRRDPPVKGRGKGFAHPLHHRTLH